MENQEIVVTNEDRIKATKQCRVNLDAALQTVRELRPSRSVSLAITNIQQGIMWLGMELKMLAAPDPYPDSYNPENAKVEPTADGLKL